MSDKSQPDQQHQVPDRPAFVAPAVRTAFEGLTEKERQYAHELLLAAWTGYFVTSQQVSHDAPALVRLVIDTAIALDNRGLLSSDDENKIPDELAPALNYCASILANAGQYLGLGDTKFVPRCPPETLLELAELAAGGDHGLVQRWNEAVSSVVYDLSASPANNVREIGWAPDEGTSGYYGPGVTRADVEAGNAFAAATIGKGEGNESLLNTRVFLCTELVPRRDVRHLEVRVAAEVSKPKFVPCGTPPWSQPAVGPDGVWRSFLVSYGDYGPELLARVAEHVERAKQYAANANQTQMLDRYAAYFRTGSIAAHKDSQRAWIQDVGPSVECNIGFVESYRDPGRARAEFEGFVAVVNRTTSARFGRLVDAAPDLIRALPWDARYEKKQFQRPDFTALDVLGFAGSMVPAGINIPNYDDIRDNEGFKNVSLSNVISARDESRPIPYVGHGDGKFLKEWADRVFELHVGLHELIGHGSGRLLHEGESDGGMYKPGDTWETRFGEVSCSYEECRAECVGIFLANHPAALGAFDLAPHAAEIDYGEFLFMARAGLAALEFYGGAETRKWRQAHARARWAILRVLVAAGTAKIDAKEATVSIDRARLAEGRAAVGDFLGRLHVFKATGNAAEGVAFYEEATAVGDAFLPLRELVLAKKQPRNINVFPVTERAEDGDGKIQLVEFPGTAAGMLASFARRFAPNGPLGPVVASVASPLHLELPPRFPGKLPPPPAFPFGKVADE